MSSRWSLLLLVLALCGCCGGATYRLVSLDSRLKLPELTSYAVLAPVLSGTYGEEEVWCYCDVAAVASRAHAAFSG